MAADKSKKPSLFDPEALLEAQRRNFQALANAGNIVADGMRSYAERQVAMVRESMSHLWSELQSVGKRAPAAPTDQLERMRDAFEKVVAQVQELGQHMLEVQSQAMAVLNECATKNLEVLGTAAPELAALQQKAKNAFEQASKQTSAVIDEMKKRMASLEHETKSAAAAAVAGQGTGRQAGFGQARPGQGRGRPSQHAGQGRPGQGRGSQARGGQAQRWRRESRRPASRSPAEPAQPLGRAERRASPAGRDPVPAERREGVAGEEAHEGAHDDDRGDERGQRGHGDVEAQRAVEPVPALVEVEQRWRPSMVGMARKNENSAAALRSSPSSTPPMIVAPARDTPGIIETVWQRPMPSAVAGGTSAVSWKRGRCAMRSISRMITPPTSSATATTQGENR